MEPRARALGSRDQQCWIDGLIGWFGGNRGGTEDLEAVGGERWLGRDGSRWVFGGVAARLGGWDRSPKI